MCSSSTKHDCPLHRQSISLRNSNNQLCLTVLQKQASTVNVCHQLFTALHNILRHISNTALSCTRLHLFRNSSHDFPPFISTVLSLGSAPCNLNRIFNFDKCQVMDLYIIRQLCKLKILFSVNIILTTFSSIFNTSSRYSPIVTSDISMLET